MPSAAVSWPALLAATFVRTSFLFVITLLAALTRSVGRTGTIGKSAPGAVAEATYSGKNCRSCEQWRGRTTAQESQGRQDRQDRQLFGLGNLAILAGNRALLDVRKVQTAQK